jgi:hypothetical protein
MVGATAPLLMTILSDLVTKPTLFVALTVKLNVPTVVGVPDINPVFVFKPKPVGRLPSVIIHVIGVVPVAVRVWL